jgi:HEAT repeat protein
VVIDADLKDAPARALQGHLRIWPDLADELRRRTGARFIVSLAAVFNFDAHRLPSMVCGHILTRPLSRVSGDASPAATSLLQFHHEPRPLGMWNGGGGVSGSLGEHEHQMWLGRRGGTISCGCASPSGRRAVDGENAWRQTRSMKAVQLDLFQDFDGAAVRPSPALSAPTNFDVAETDDHGLLAAFGDPALADNLTLLAEAGRRRLAAAVPLLRDVCRRHAGFGAHRQIPEQAAALSALHAIGTREAGQAVADAIERGWVEGPTLPVAVGCARRLHAHLSCETIAMLLQHPDPSVRLAGCGCARPYPGITALLGELMVDLHRPVAKAAACALGRLGRVEARPVLAALLESAPSEEVIEAAGAVADEPSLVLLGRIARSASKLASAALAALEDSDHPRAAKIRAAIVAPRSASASAR